MIKISVTAILIGISSAVSGCVTTEELATQDNNECHSYGAETGTNNYFQCRMLKDQQHIQQRAAALAQFNRGLENMAAAYAPPQTVVVVP